MHRLRLAVVVALGSLAALACLAPAAGAQTRAGTTRLVAQALAGLGGRSAVSGLRTFRLQTTGRTWIFDEGLRPDDEVTPASTFTQTLNVELRSAGDRLRADSVRTSQGAARTVSEVLKGRLGYISGVDANGGSPATTAMTSDRWAAVRREQRLLNPQLLLRDVIRRPALATTAPPTTLRGRPHRLLVINDDVAPIRLYVDSRTGRIDRLSTEDHQYLRRDVRLIVDFGGWRAVRAATGAVRVRFPRTASIRLDGKVIHTETRTSIAVNRPASAARFRFPAGIAPAFDAKLASRGAATTEWLMSFAQDGFPKDGPADQIVPRAVAPGSTLIQGIPNNSMIVEQSNGIVVVEGALNDFRAEALIRYINRTYPGKPVRYVTASHHHADHAGGMRPFVALGATAVIGADAVPLFRRVLGDRSSRLLARPSRRHDDERDDPPRRRRRRGDADRRRAAGDRPARDDAARDDDDPRLRARRGRAVRQRRHVHARWPVRPGRAVARADDRGERPGGAVDRRRARRGRALRDVPGRAGTAAGVTRRRRGQPFSASERRTASMRVVCVSATAPVVASRTAKSRPRRMT